MQMRREARVVIEAIHAGNEPRVIASTASLRAFGFQPNAWHSSRTKRFPNAADPNGSRGLNLSATSLI